MWFKFRVCLLGLKGLRRRGVSDMMADGADVGVEDGSGSGSLISK
jgi:hypothetical protein